MLNAGQCLAAVGAFNAEYFGVGSMLPLFFFSPGFARRRFVVSEARWCLPLPRVWNPRGWRCDLAVPSPGA